MTVSGTTDNHRIARAAGTVMLAFLLSNITGLVRQILVANAFGTQAEMEAFNAANRVAETLFYLVAGGALASAFIPTFTSLVAREQRDTAWRLASAIANLILVVLILAGVLAAIFAPWIVRTILAPGFAADPAKEALTISLLRLMLVSSVIFGMSGLVMGILNSFQIFFIPALAPSMYQLGMIFGVLVLTPRLQIYGLAWGVIIGAGFHLALQIPSLLRLKGRYYPTLGLNSPEVREVARLMGPRLLGIAVVQLNFWINTRLASRFVEGSVTGVTLAFTIMLMPQVAIAQSIAIAAMPTFSLQAALGKLIEMRTSLASSLRGALLLAIPASIGLIILRTPLIKFLYQRGEFDSFSTGLVAWALLWYAIGLVGHAIVEILSRAFYALHDTKTPVFIGVMAMSLNIALSFLLSGWFEWLYWMPHGGLALANSVATGLEAVALIALMRYRLGGLDGSRVWAGSFQALAGTLVMSLCLWGWLRLTNSQPVWAIAVGGILLGGIIYGLMALLMGVDEIRGIVRLVKGRLLV